jgi:hypothetical protein
MVQFKYSDLNSMQFINAISRLSGRPLPVKTAYNVKKWADAIMAARKKISEEFQAEVLTEFAEKGEDGAIRLKDKHDLSSYTIPEDAQAAYNEAMEKFGERLYKLDRRKIVLEELGNIEISASELTALEPVLTTVEEEAMSREHLKAVPGGPV